MNWDLKHSEEGHILVGPDLSCNLFFAFLAYPLQKKNGNTKTLTTTTTTDSDAGSAKQSTTTDAPSTGEKNFFTVEEVLEMTDN